METLVAWLTGLLADIIRPIIREELEQLKDFVREQILRLQVYKKYDEEAQELIDLIAKANTSEERWAYVAKLKAKRPMLDV